MPLVLGLIPFSISISDSTYAPTRAVETHFKKPRCLGFFKKPKKPEKLGF